MQYQSENINELIKALASIQSKIEPAIKDQDNPYFKSKYADLASIWAVCRELLGPAGLAVIQTMDYQSEKSFLITTLAHSSGQYIKSMLPLVCKDPTDPQKLGSSITYMRRYALAAIVGITPDEDDDGNKASTESKRNKELNTKIKAEFFIQTDAENFLKKIGVVKENQTLAIQYISKVQQARNLGTRKVIADFEEKGNFLEKFNEWKTLQEKRPDPKAVTSE